MLTKIFILLLASITLSGCNLKARKSGLEIMSYPVATVYINNKEVGNTPYKNLDLKPGENLVRLVTENRDWTKTVDLQNNISTVIDWQLGENYENDSGYILYLEKTGSKKASLLVNSSPDKANILIDGVSKGSSPIKVEEVLEGDRQLTLSAPGYKDINVFMKAISGYQLVVESKLAKEKNHIEEITEESIENTEINLSTEENEKVIIKETETGWLKVRDTNSLQGKEMAKIKPGGEYPLLDEANDWYKIDLGTSGTGWISATYAEKK